MKPCTLSSPTPGFDWFYTYDHASVLRTPSNPKIMQGQRMIFLSNLASGITHCMVYFIYFAFYRQTISLLYIPIQERHDLPSSASGIRGEMSGIRPVGDSFAHCPQHRVIVVFAVAHIHEGVHCAGGLR